MSWRMFLLVMVMASGWSTVHLGGIIYTHNLLNQTHYDKQVRFFYNGSVPKPWDIQLLVENRTVPTELVDDFTISFSVNRIDLIPNGLEFQCIWPDNDSTKDIITDSSFLYLVDFSCNYTDLQAELECSFGYYERPSNIALTMDNKFDFNCTSEFEPSSYKCSLQYPDNFQGIERRFTAVDSNGVSKMYMKNLTDIEMRMPFLPSNGPNIEQVEFGICMDFGLLAFQNSDSYECRVRLLDSGFVIEYFPIISYSDAGSKEPKDCCFKSPPYYFSTFRAELGVRYRHKDAPWISKEISFTTKAFRPNKPPEFLENGFYYDPNKEEIHLFWLELDNQDVNGPNLTYILVSDKGKKPLHQGNFSAVFHDWDPLQPSIVFIWSQNSEGRSLESNNLSIPILTNYKRHQPRNLKFHLKDLVLTWDPPQEEQNITGYYIYSCSGDTNSNNICENDEQLHLIDRLSIWARSFQFYYDSLKMAVVAVYTDSVGFMKWYGDSTESFEEEGEPKSIGLGISLSIAGLILLTLTALAYFLFQKWKRKKVKEFVVSLPPIFDPVAMDRLRLRNVIFPQSRDPPIEIMPSVYNVPQRLFLDSFETTAIVERTTARLPPSLDPTDPISSPYAVINEDQLTRRSDPPDSISSPYTDSVQLTRRDDPPREVPSPYTEVEKFNNFTYTQQ